MARSAAEIDALLAAAKAIFGEPRWIESGARATLTSALTDKAGGVIGGVELRFIVLTHLPLPQRGTAVLLLDRFSLCRLSFRPDHPHTNGARHPIRSDLRRLKLAADRSRIYRWSDDRIWPRPDALGTADTIEPEPDSLDTAFALFLRESGIRGRLPSPPYRPTLEL